MTISDRGFNGSSSSGRKWLWRRSQLLSLCLFVDLIGLRPNRGAQQR
jgi:hypothetical protein